MIFDFNSRLLGSNHQRTARARDDFQNDTLMAFVPPPVAPPIGPPTAATPVAPPTKLPLTPPLFGNPQQAQEQRALRVDFLLFGGLRDAPRQALRQTFMGPAIPQHYETAIQRAVLGTRRDAVRMARESFTDDERREIGGAVAKVVGELIGDRIPAGSGAFGAGVRSAFDLAFSQVKARRRRADQPQTAPTLPRTTPAPVPNPATAAGSTPAPSSPAVAPQENSPGLTPQRLAARIGDFLPRAGSNPPAVYGTHGGPTARRDAEHFNRGSDTTVAIPLRVKADIGGQEAESWVVYSGVDPASAANLARNVDATSTFTVLNRDTALQDAGLSPEGLAARIGRRENAAFARNLPVIGGRQMSPLMSEQAYVNARSTVRGTNGSAIERGRIDSLDLVVPLQNSRGASIEGVNRGQVTSLLNTLEQSGRLRAGVNVNDVVAANRLGALIATDPNGRAFVRDIPRTAPGTNGTIPDPWTTPSEPVPFPISPEIPTGPDAPKPAYPAVPDPWEAGPDNGDPSPSLWSGAPSKAAATPPEEEAENGGQGSGGDGGDNGGVPPIGTGGLGSAPEPEPEPEPQLNALQRWMKKNRDTHGQFNKKEQEEMMRRGLIKPILETLKAAAGINAIGAAGNVAFQAGQERRTSAPVTEQNAFEELARLQNDPKGYINDNYENAALGIFPIGDHLYNVSGDLRQMDKNGTEYFRRVPEDLFIALRDVQNASGIDTSNGIFVDEVLKRNGKEERISVEIRPPYRLEPFRDARASFTLAQGSHLGSFGLTSNVNIGPPEWQKLLDANFSLVWNYHYSTPAVSTFRVQLPTQTQGGGVGARQQVTAPVFLISANATALDFNPEEVKNITNPEAFASGTNYTVIRPGAFFQAISRDRVRFDFGTDKSFFQDISKGYVSQEKVLVGFEGGLSMIIAQRKQGADVFNANMYKEGQWYPVKFEAKIGNSGSGIRLSPLSLPGVDFAWQVSTSNFPAIFEKVPTVLTPEPMRMQDPQIFRLSIPHPAVVPAPNPTPGPSYTSPFDPDRSPGMDPSQGRPAPGPSRLRP